MGLIRALKLRPGVPVAHGERMFAPPVEAGMEAGMRTIDGKPARFTLSEIQKVPTTVGRSVIGRPARGPSAYYLGLTLRVQSCDEDFLRDILVNKASSFHKPPTMKTMLGAIIGTDSLLLTEGDQHALHRRLVSKAFTFDLLKQMLPIMRRCAWSAVDALADSDERRVPAPWLFDPAGVSSPAAVVDRTGDEPVVPERFRDAPVVDASRAMSGLTLEIIAQSAFGGSFGSGEAEDGAAVVGNSAEAMTVSKALHASFSDFNALMTRLPIAIVFPWIRHFVPRPERAAFAKALAELDALADRVIAKRQAILEEGGGDSPASGSGAAGAKGGKDKPEDLLSLLLKSTVTGGEMSARDRALYMSGGDATDDAVALEPGEAAAVGKGKGKGEGKGEDKPSRIRQRSSVTRLSAKELRDQIVTFVMAGHETTSQLLTWCLYCLTQAPEWQSRLHKEAHRVFSSSPPPAAGGDGEADATESWPSLEAIKTGMPICNAVIQETLRMFAPASVVGREAVKDVTVRVGGRDVLIPAGGGVTIPIGALHRDETVFADPDDFDPSRWLGDDIVVAELGMTRSGAGGLGPGDDPVATARPQLKGLGHFRFLPFTAGPRNCVGQRFALMEARVALAAIAAKLEWHLDPQYVHAPSIRVTTQATRGMPMRFRLLET